MILLPDEEDKEEEEDKEVGEELLVVDKEDKDELIACSPCILINNISCGAECRLFCFNSRRDGLELFCMVASRRRDSSG